MGTALEEHRAQTEKLPPVYTPSCCPPWCNAEDHRQYVEENQGGITPAEADTHVCTTSRFLDALPRFNSNGGNVRERGTEWCLRALQRQNPTVSYGVDPEMIELSVSSHYGQDGSASIEVTTGELRVFVAHALALCDRVDLAHLGPGDR